MQTTEYATAACQKLLLLTLSPSSSSLLDASSPSPSFCSILKASRIDRIYSRLRGVDNVDEEFNDLVEASEAAKLVKHPWSTLLTRKYRPQLVFAICIPAFQQLTGMNVITFYAPILFKTIGFGSIASLASALITNGVNFLATFVSIGLVDEFGRRFLFLEGGLQMFITQVVVGSAMAWKFGTSGNPGELSKGFAATLLVTLICIYVAGFAWSWGPLGSAAQAINVSVNMVFTFAIAQVFTAMLCHMKLIWIVLLLLLFLLVRDVLLHLQVTKAVPIEEMERVREQNPFWRKYVVQEKGIAMGKAAQNV
ncbi:hypothetical protein ABKV19_006314 [Rosa sericea]